MAVYDSDLNKRGEHTIRWSQNHDCPKCGATDDITFDTGKFDQDGLADLEPGDLVQPTKCPNCEHVHEVEYTGWSNYGDAG